MSFGRHLTGYELKQFADSSLRFFYAAPAMSQVYSELDKLEAAGFVNGRETTVGERTIRVHSISRKGITALRRWLAQSPVGPPSLKHHLALRIFLGHMTEPGRLLEQVAGQRSWCEQTLTDLAIVRDGLEDDPDGRWSHARIVADWGLDYYRAELSALDRLASALAEGSPAVVRPRT
ncbi:MAG TPA: PadR family transcriptional regulator [Ilumatobacteraceae bacterium]|nr:PadR family transcriptional regulator [Ilumatobacteraceae bacterium]